MAARRNRLPDPPAEYDPRYMRQLIRELELTLDALRATGRIEGTTANLSRLPTSSAGLAAGELWNDSGDVKITT